MDSANAHKTSKFRFAFKLVEQSQRSLIHSWLAQKHISEWLHGEGLQNTHKGLDEFLAGFSSWGQHWIAYDSDIPFAYLLTSNEGKEAITLDLFIGDLNYLSKGLGVQMIKEFLLSQFANKREVLIDPEATNTRAIHVYEKVGFHKVGEFIAKWHPVPHIQLKLDMKKLLNQECTSDA